MARDGKITVKTILKKKAEGVPIVALTAYDYFTAKYLDEAGVDLILVGDSVEMVLYGSETTLTASMEKMPANCCDSCMVVPSAPTEPISTA